VPARTQFTGRQLLVSNIEKKESLDAIDLTFVAPVQFVLNYVKQLAVQAFDQIERLEIELRFDANAFIRRSLRLR
jgi:hypothetical protein